MATVTAATTATIATTSNASSYVSGSFTPAANDLIVVMTLTGNLGNPTSLTCTDSLGLLTFTEVGRATCAGSVDGLIVFVADQLATAAARTVTIAHTAQSANGNITHVARVAGMTLTGTAAVRQFAKQDNFAAGATPATTFAGVALTGNTILTQGANVTNPWATAVPASFTQGQFSGYATTAHGSGWAFRDSGHTSTTVTWGGTSATAGGTVSVELDTSAAAANEMPDVVMAPMTH